MLPNDLRLYVLTRQDLNLPYRSCQAGHAVIQWANDYPDLNKEWNNHVLIYLSVPNETELKQWMYKLRDQSIKYSIFIEPDLDYQITALSCLLDNTELFSELDLMR